MFPFAAKDEKKTDVEEIDFLPLERHRPFHFPDLAGLDDDFGDQPIVDTGYVPSPFYNPFGGLFQNLEGNY